MKMNFKLISLSIISLWLIIFCVTPILLIFITSFLHHSANQLLIWQFTVKNYVNVTQWRYLIIFWRSIKLSSFCTFLCLLLAYPTAYAMYKCKAKYQPLLLLFLMIPFWTSSLIRSYAMLAILKAKGLLNSTLIALGIIHHPLQILYTNSAVLIGMVYNLLPFMILPIYANLTKLNPKLFEAAKDLGASSWYILRKILLPLTAPGVVGGILLVFLPAMTLFYIPDILGGAKSLLFGNLIENEFLSFRNWPNGAAISVILTAIMSLLIIFYRKMSHGQDAI